MPKPYCRKCGSYNYENAGPDHMPIYCRDCNSTDVFFPPMPAEAQVIDTVHHQFLQMVKEAGLSEPRSKTHVHGELEFARHTGTDLIGDRRWRFDYAWPDHMIAIERDGGVWQGRSSGKAGRRGSGGHQGGFGQLRDMEKGNAAVALGWRLLRFTPEQMAGKMPLLWLQFLMSKNLPDNSEI